MVHGRIVPATGDPRGVCIGGSDYYCRGRVLLMIFTTVSLPNRTNCVPVLLSSGATQFDI